MAEGAQPPPPPPPPSSLSAATSTGSALLDALDNSGSSGGGVGSNSILINNSNNNNNPNTTRLCGMLGINMPCEAAGHDFSTVRKELEYVNSIASHYGANLSEKGDHRGVGDHQQRVASFKIEDRERSDNCSRSNSPVLDELSPVASSRSKVAAALRSREKMSPLALPTASGSPVTNSAAAAAAVAAAAQVHLNGTMQDMMNLQKLQSLAQMTGGAAVLPGLGLSNAGLPTPALPSAAAALLSNSPLNLSLGAQSHSPVMGALAAAPQTIPSAASQMPQLILASGQIGQGIQGAQLLIPTSQGIATQTILTIPMGQQVISSMSSENLLQCLNFNTVANNNFNDMLNQSTHHHHPGNAAFAAAAAAAAAVATRESPVTVNSPINTNSLLANPLALAAAAAANNNHHHHSHHHHHQMHHQHQHQQQQQQTHQQHQAKHLHFGHQSVASSSGGSLVTPSSAHHHHQQPPSSGGHVIDRIKNLSTHEKTPSERSTPEMRIKLESPNMASPSGGTPQPSSSRPGSGSFASCVFDKSPPLKRTISPSIPPCAGSNSSSNSNGSSCSSNNSCATSGLSGSAGGQMQLGKNRTSPHHSPSDGAISRITTSNGEITVTKSQAPSTPPLSVQKNHAASLHFNPSISPKPMVHHTRDQHHHPHHHPHHHLHHQQQQQQHQHQGQQHSAPSSHNSTQLVASAAAASTSTSGDTHLQKEPQQGLHKPSACSTSSSSALSSTTPGMMSLTLDDVEQKISPHSVGSSSSKRHRSLTPPPRKLSPTGSGSVLLSQDDEEDDDNNSNPNELEDSPNELTINQTNCNVVDGIDLDDIKEFAKAFKLRRLSLGLTQTQVGQALSVTEGPAYSQSAICRFEKLDITPKSAQKIKPVLERWMKDAEESHSSRFKSGQNHLTDFIGVEPSKKRKRRTSFTPQALELLNGHFERNTHPSGTEITGLAHQLGYEREVIRIWFCNKRQALKNTVRMMSKNFKMETS
ncbi:putative uncharacterized protein DDB_G0277255 isoform X2 [Toxorhynchites rutilus septentrionalis]|uniref:putative uncharacterized protein DDB_G0277255 isoform X2 n=1 Tax=Toxorhynchites rutilus septentrionalis TaxID=329112 RepID=UPI002479DC10|nr:putative uncharacterized protein DDB_G0277255 isoform X2 [Toxorhynchites rutilus septentrionalis]